MTRELEQLSGLIKMFLQSESPILSGNMQSSIKFKDYVLGKATIEISGKSYNISKWEETGKIEYTGEYDYAISVNKVGAFGGRSKKSKHWANKSVVNSVKQLASVFGYEVIVDVDIS